MVSNWYQLVPPLPSPEKFVMDCEVLQMIQRYFEEATFATTEDDLAFDAIKEVGPGGHYFGVQHTQDRYQQAFYAPGTDCHPEEMGLSRRVITW